MQFETARLTLRLATLEEARAIRRGETPPGMSFADGYPASFTLEVMDLLTGERAVAAPSFESYFMFRKADGKVVGEIGGSPEPADPRVFTVGYDVAPSVEGQGYTTEALLGLIAFLAGRGITAVRADTFVDHIASRRVMEKAGMHLVEEFEREEDGKPARLVLYEVLLGP